MAETLKVLAQLVPPAAALTDLYTVPAATQAVVSSLTMCNTGVATTVRVTVAVAGAAHSLKNYLYYDLPLGAGDTFTATLGITLGAGDVVRVYNALATVAFQLFGSELS